ncbi:MAG: hypothetical protein Q9209_004311 [Squamulea sp. 1 TL-2023]
MPPPEPSEGVAFEVTTSLTSGSSKVHNTVDVGNACQAQNVSEAGSPIDDQSPQSNGSNSTSPNNDGAQCHHSEIGCTLLVHAKLYALAHYLQLTTLKSLAFGAIEAEIESIEELQPQLLANIVQLARYVYTSTDTLVISTEQLRDLVATFVGNWFHVFHGPDVNNLLEEGGEFVVDVMQKVQQHVKDIKAEHKENKKELQRQIKRYQTRLRKRGGVVDGTGKDSDNTSRGRCFSIGFPSSISQAQLSAIFATTLISPEVKMEGKDPTSAFSSRILEIIVGPSERAFYAHTDILAKSDVLRMIVHGGGKETEEGKIVWPHWTVSAAEKLLEWLYTGDYKCPYPTAVLQSETVSTEENTAQASEDKIYDELENPDLDHPMSVDVPAPAEPEIVYDDTPRYNKKKKKYSESRMMWSIPDSPKPVRSAFRSCLKDLTWNGSHPLEKMSEAEEFDKWTGHQLWRPDQLNYEATFMTHAELYNMACIYQLDTLKNMAWQRLRSVLVSIGRPVPGSTVMGNIVTLIHYTYEITGEVGNEEEPLRKLVTTFAALNFTRFKGTVVDELIKSASEPDREFVMDLMAMVRQKVDNKEYSDSE